MDIFPQSIVKTLSLFFFLYIVVGIFLFFMQRKFIYFPTPQISHNYPVETFSQHGINIRTTILNSGKDNAILYFGGNAEEVTYNGPAFEKTFPNHTVYLFHYRGYSGSEGEPTEKGIYKDAQAVFNQLTKRHQNISVIGRSLGTGVATYLAADNAVHRLALITPFDSIERIAQAQYPIYPLKWLLLDKYNSVSRAKRITAKTLVITADEDTIIPAKHSQNLINAFNKDLISAININGRNHNNISDAPNYYPLLSQFINGSIDK